MWSLKFLKNQFPFSFLYFSSTLQDSICRFVQLIRSTKLRVNILKRQVSLYFYIFIFLFEKSESINYIPHSSNLFILNVLNVTESYQI